MPYASAFAIEQHARLAAKQAMRMAGEKVSKWRGFAQVKDLEVVAVPGAEPRSTLAGKFEWSIDLKDWDERVFFYFGNVELVLHFEKALLLAADLRAHAKVAKAWAGDRGRSMRAAGSLTDAETNYKNGWN